MNRLQSASVLKTEPQHPTSEALFRSAEPLPDASHHRADSSADIWSLVITGCLSAAMITSLSSRLPQSHTLSWTTILLHSIKYIALTTMGGAIGTSIPWFFLKVKPPFSLASFAKIVAVSWIFFPGILLFYRRQSPWMFLVLALATVASAFSLRRLFPVISEPDQRKAPDGYTSDLPNLYGLPIAAFRPVRAFFIAICAQAALLLAVADRPSPAGLLLSICLALLVWRWSALDSSTIKQFAGRRQSILLSALALCFTVLALLPWIAEKSYGSKEVPRRPALITHESKEADVPGSDYVGIILLASADKKDRDRPAQTAHHFLHNRKGVQTNRHSI